MLKIAVIINSIDLAVTIRPSYDTNLEDICHLLLEFLFDLCHSRPQELRSIVAEELLKLTTSPFTEHISKDRRQMTNLQCLLLLESRMWKKARKIFRDMLVAMLGVDQDVRCQIGLLIPPLILFLTTSRSPICFSLQESRRKLSFTRS